MKKKETQPELSYEEAADRLEAVLRELESPTLTLEASMALFEEGVRLSARCKNLLDNAEQRVTQLLHRDDGTTEETPLEPAGKMEDNQ